MNLIKAPASDILAAINKVANVVPAKSPLPILPNILIAPFGSEVSFTGSDIDTQVTATANLGVDTADAQVRTTVAASRLLPLLKSLPADQVVTLTQEAHKLTLKAGRSRFNLQTMDARDFPMFAEGSAEMGSFEVPQLTLAKLIDQTHYAMADGDHRAFLNGLLFELNGAQLSVAGSNGVRIAVGRAMLGTSFDQRETIIPRKAVLELRRLLTTSDESVKVKLTATNARFEFGNVVFLTKIIGAKYPNMDRVLSMAPSANEYVATNRAALLAMFKRAALVLDDKVKGVRMKFAPGLLTLVSAGVGEDGEQDCDFDYTGPEFVAAFPIAQVIDGLAAFGDDLVRLHFAPDKPLLMTYQSDASWRYCVMPMRL